MKLEDIIKLKLNNFQIEYPENLGGEGSGCQGDNCGRPAGSGGGESSGGGQSAINVTDKEVGDTMTKAKETGEEINTLGKSIAEKYGGTVTPLSYKSAESIKRKVDNEYGGNINELKDSVRNTVILSNESAVDNALNELSQNKDVLRIKRQKAESDPLGYSGSIMNVRMSNGLIGEVQVNTDKMIYAKQNEKSARKLLGDKKYDAIRKETGKEGGLGHTYYEEWRVLHPVKDKVKRDEIAKKSKNYYSKFR
jgi:hypothetical protein